MASAPSWKRKWQNLRDNAKCKGVVCTLSLDDYIALAKQAGITSPDMIGKSVEKYQMGRIGDTGNYEIGNCRFITMRQNLDERRINGGNKKISEKMKGSSGNGDQKRGRTKETHSYVLSQSDKVSKSFRVVSPGGVVYEGRNVTEFCSIHNLNQSCLSALCRGVKPVYKGWTGSYI